MGKRKDVGRALENISKANRQRNRKCEFKHPAAVSGNAGRTDWCSLPVRSVTEQDTVTEFFSLAQLTNAEFTAQKSNPKFVTVGDGAGGILSAAQKKLLTQRHEENKGLLTIPRRPAWDSNTSSEELERREREAFLEWRRQLAALEAAEDLVLTPFEKNLDFWRQLWRVIERSHCVVQILDARNPLLFRCLDLETYVREVDSKKSTVLLINKADLLTKKQREIWAKHFAKEGTRVMFWSAKSELEKCMKGGDEASSSDEEEEEEVEEEEEEEEEEEREEEKAEASSPVSDQMAAMSLAAAAAIPLNSAKLLNAHQLLLHLREHHVREKGAFSEETFTVGLVGYPNVGKSSTLNAILRVKKAPVSATPGRTKHFQTFYVEPEEGDCEERVLICDCPGLVMPSFAFSKSHLIVSGILPVDNMRDYFSPINVICGQIPRYMLERIYGIHLPVPKEGEDPNRDPTARELLEAYSQMHGYMGSKGNPNCDRAARILLKDYINGRLLYCHPPPDVAPSVFQPLSRTLVLHSRKLRAGTKPETAEPKAGDLTDFDRNFLSAVRPSSGFCGKARPENFSPSARPEHSSKKHGNQKKREKLRRVHSHLDQW